MGLGESLLSSTRYEFKTFAFFAWWEDEAFLNGFLEHPSYRFFDLGWHVRMRLYRRWGEVAAIKNAIVEPDIVAPNKPIVAVTLARLNLLHTSRFIRWGKPVEGQVRDHNGQRLALAALRPCNTFSTFSIWENERQLINMVHGKNRQCDGDSHRLAMQERVRKDFHFEFTTMRFTPLKDVGLWKGKSNYTLP